MAGAVTKLIYCRRLTVRVAFAAALWASPTLIGTTPEQADKVKDAAVSVLLVAVASWVSTQGQRRPNRGG